MASKASSSLPGAGWIPKLLLRADKDGINAGGLCLIALGLYGGQYASLFPEQLRNIAGGFCLFVAAAGLIYVIYCLLRAKR
jgi:hypothetical protein